MALAGTRRRRSARKPEPLDTEELQRAYLARWASGPTAEHLTSVDDEYARLTRIVKTFPAPGKLTDEQKATISRWHELRMLRDQLRRERMKPTAVQIAQRYLSMVLHEPCEGRAHSAVENAVRRIGGRLDAGPFIEERGGFRAYCRQVLDNEIKRTLGKEVRGRNAKALQPGEPLLVRLHQAPWVRKIANTGTGPLKMVLDARIRPHRYHQNKLRRLIEAGREPAVRIDNTTVHLLEPLDETVQHPVYVEFSERAVQQGNVLLRVQNRTPVPLHLRIETTEVTAAGRPLEDGVHVLLDTRTGFGFTERRRYELLEAMGGPAFDAPEGVIDRLGGAAEQALPVPRRGRPPRDRHAQQPLLSCRHPPSTGPDAVAALSAAIDTVAADPQWRRRDGTVVTGIRGAVLTRANARVVAHQALQLAAAADPEATGSIICRLAEWQNLDPPGTDGGEPVAHPCSIYVAAAATHNPALARTSGISDNTPNQARSRLTRLVEDLLAAAGDIAHRQIRRDSCH